MSTSPGKILKKSRIPRAPPARKIAPPDSKVEFSPGRSFPLIAVVQTKLRSSAIKQKLQRKKSSCRAVGQNSAADKCKRITKKLCEGAGIDALALDQIHLLSTDSLFYLCSSERVEPVLIPRLLEIKDEDLSSKGERVLFSSEYGDFFKARKWLVVSLSRKLIVVSKYDLFYVRAVEQIILNFVERMKGREICFFIWIGSKVEKLLSFLVQRYSFNMPLLRTNAKNAFVNG